MIKEEDLTVEMVKYWIHLYKKIKSGEATELERRKLDDFTYHYLEYVENTGVFYVSHNAISADGYLLGSNATSAKRRKQEGKMSDQTALKYDMLGFFWGKKKEWKVCDNITPIRADILKQLRTTTEVNEANDQADQIIQSVRARHTQSVDDLTTTQKVVNLYKKIKLGIATEAEQRVMDRFTYYYLDHIRTTGSFYVPSSYTTPDGYQLGSVYALYSKKGERGKLTDAFRQKLDNIGYYWHTKKRYSDIYELNPTRQEVLKTLHSGEVHTYDGVLPDTTQVSHLDSEIGMDTILWINLYKKIKANTASEQERMLMDDFIYNYLDYIYNTGMFLVPTKQISDTGYKVGKDCTKYKSMRVANEVTEKLLAKLDSVGFYWGTRDEWHTNESNMTPLRCEILRLLNTDELQKENTSNMEQEGEQLCKTRN